jgi:hypothetical protein
MRARVWRLAVLVISTLGVAGGARAQQPLPFTDGGWDLKGSAVAVRPDGPGGVLDVENGLAYRRDVTLLDGAIEFEVQLTRRRSFVYVMFRMQADHEYQEFYLRPHKSNLPDAAQYAPVWQGSSAWQLHHGPGGTAAVGFEPGVWTQVRVLLKGPRAALFVGDMATPVLLVDHLAQEPKPGFIALRGFLPAGVPGDAPIARYRNVSVRSGEVAFDWPAPEAPPEVPGVVRSWAVSHSFKPADSIATSLPSAETLGDLQRVDAEPGGLVELHRHVKLPDGSRAAAAVASLHLKAQREGVYALDLGFSDTATVFLNGRPLFHGDARYSFDRPRRDGLIGFDQARLFLPLRAGDNELRIVVADYFGGWGLMARFPDATGLVVEAR